jgi:hypothetical protein
MAVTMIETGDIVAIKMITPMRKMNNIPMQMIMTMKLQVKTFIIASLHIPHHVTAGRVGGQVVEINARTMDPYELNNNFLFGSSVSG